MFLTKSFRKSCESLSPFINRTIFLIAVMTVSVSVQAALPMKPLPNDLGEKFRFDLLTPTGDIIFRNSVLWESIQIDYSNYPKPAKCAANVTKVMRLSELPNYQGESVGKLLKSVVDQGGTFIKFPKDKKGIINKLNQVYQGRLPVGTVVGGCLYSDCMDGKKGQRHAAVVSNVNAQGVVYLHHNNWYRPENENGHRKAFMVSEQFLNLGFPRQWMQTPWIKIVRGHNGLIKDIIPQLPAIDDLDPTQYFISLVIPKEITREIADGRFRATNPFATSANGGLNVLGSFNDHHGVLEEPRPDDFDVSLDLDFE